MRRPRQQDQTLQHTPDQAPPQTAPTLQCTPHQTPQQTPRQTPESNTQNEFSSTDNDVWKVGSMHHDGRLQVEIIRGVLEPSGKVSSTTRGIMYERLEPKGFTWKEVSAETKKFYFEEFKKWVVWREPDHLVYATWLKSAAMRYSDLVYKARQHWQEGRLNNRVGQDVWLSWIGNWQSPEFQAKSKIKKSNRKGGVEGDGPYPPTHTGGSKSHSSYAANLAEKYKRNPNPTEVYAYVHTKDHDEKTWIDEKSANVYEKLKNLRAERSHPIEGSSTPQPVDENQLFYDAVGGRNKRNRIYGLGSSQDIFYEPRSTALSCYNNSSSHPNTEEYQKLQAELQEMKNRLQDMDEMKQQMQEMKNLLAAISSNQN